MMFEAVDRLNFFDILINHAPKVTVSLQKDCRIPTNWRKTKTVVLALKNKYSAHVVSLKRASARFDLGSETNQHTGIPNLNESTRFELRIINKSSLKKYTNNTTE